MKTEGYINKGFGLRAQPHFRFLEQPKVVAVSFVVRDAQDAARRFLNDKLRFYRVPLLLARVVSPLSFFGRSMGVSVASIRI